jgi:fructose-1,6-bisphosphatase/sedoheptulose 1,7-bisphosphatase-like protein
VKEEMILVALGRGRLKGIIDIIARHTFVVFGTMDGNVLADLTACFTDTQTSEIPVYFYETG